MVTITDECFTLTEQFPVEVIIDFYIETPGAFTPNGDDNNDIFMPETENIRELKNLKYSTVGAIWYLKRHGLMKDGMAL